MLTTDTLSQGPLFCQGGHTPLRSCFRQAEEFPVWVSSTFSYIARGRRPFDAQTN